MRSNTMLRCRGWRSLTLALTLFASTASLQTWAQSSSADCSRPANLPNTAQLNLRAKGVRCAPLGYAEYVPATYNSQTNFPVIIAFHGDTQGGVGTVTDVQKLDDDGLPREIKAGTWDINKRFVVLAPQMNWETRTAQNVHDFIQFAKTYYKIDPARIYLTAYSGGGGPLYKYLEAYAGGEAAAVAPVSTVYTFSGAPAPCSWKTVPTWIFHGASDTVVQPYSNATAPYDGLTNCAPAPQVAPSLTLYSGVAHDAWSRTYNLTGLNSTVVAGRKIYNQSLYDWFLQYQRTTASSSLSSASTSSQTINSSSLASSQPEGQSSSIHSSSSVPSSSSPGSSSTSPYACSTAINPLTNTFNLIAKNSNCATLGYGEYVPLTYASGNKFPLIISLSGDAQQGTGTATDLQKIDDDGLPKLVAAGTWDPTKRFIVLAPQMNWETRTAQKVHEFVQFAKANYKVDPERIYLTGYSGGGGPLYKYLETYSGGDAAAVVPTSTVYTFTGAPSPCNWKSVPAWIFHGTDDTLVRLGSNATAPYDGLNQCAPVTPIAPRLTAYVGATHDTWTRTWDLSGLNSPVPANLTAWNMWGYNNLNAYNISIYEWLLSHQRGAQSSSSISSTSQSSSSVAPVTKADPEFGTLVQLDKFNPATPDNRDTSIEPLGASTVQTILGKTALILPPQNTAGEMKASYAAFVMGKNKGLVAGKSYVLEFDYPDDVPRHIVFLNRGADLVRTVATGKEPGDYREQYAYPNPESLAYPHTGQWQTYRFYFTLHDRFQPLAAVRNEVDTKRPFGPADGFWVAIGHYSPHGNPLSQGAAVGEIRLYEVSNPAAATLAVAYPPNNLPRRRTFWREEMNDSTAMCVRGDSNVNTDPTSPAYDDPEICNPATGTSAGTTTNTWLEYKMKLAKVLGFNVFTKDLLEFGHNQGFAVSGNGGGDWFNPSRVAYWPEISQKAATYGLEVLPYFEYYGSIGSGTFSSTSCTTGTAGDNFCSTTFSNPAYQCKLPWGKTQPNEGMCYLPSYGAQKNCEPLTRSEKRYTGYSWAEIGCVDVSDPNALIDVKKLLNAGVLDVQGSTTFSGVWFRTRIGSWPISFTTATRTRYAADRNIAVPSKASLRTDANLRSDYYAWWYGKRQSYLNAIRDYLRAGKNGTNGIPDANVLFTSYHEEGLPIPATGYADARVVTDDTAPWSIINADARWQWRYPAITAQTWLTDKRYDATLSALPLPTLAQLAGTDGHDELGHGTPPADPERYQTSEGVLMTLPFGRQYTVADTALLQKFTTSEGLALIHHFPLNEDDGHGDLETDKTSGSFKNWPMSGHFGYFVSDVERSTPYTMLAEVRGVANADAYWIGYLSSNSFNTGAPQDLRRFNAAYLAWPALPSLKVATASPDAEVIVRDIVTTSGKFVAVFNTGMSTKSAVTIDLTKTRLGTVSNVQDRVSGATLPLVNGKLTLNLQVADFRVLYLP